MTSQIDEGETKEKKARGRDEKCIVTKLHYIFTLTIQKLGYPFHHSRPSL